MKSTITIFFIGVSLIFTSIAKAQPSDQHLKAYWGNVSDLELSADELLKISAIVVQDTVKGHKIAQVTKFRFLMQPMMDGPVKATVANGPYFDESIRSVMGKPQPGDKIMVTDIFANVDGQGVRQIPTAVVITIK